jgi:hypothetical protein
MTSSKDANAGWAATSVTPAGRREAPEAWQSTRAQTSLATQILQYDDESQPSEKHDIGRKTGADIHELFVSCDPAQALQQQFEHLRPDFIAVHDIATASSRKLLIGIAAASSRQVQKLVIRRQGYGTPLATLEFVELPTPDGSILRMYSTEAEADTAARQGLARMLLAFSRLGVMMVGDLPTHAVASALQPLHDFMISGPWPNRDLLLLPLASASALVTQGAELARGTGVNVRTTPQVMRPADAWGFINGAWSRLRADAAPARAAASAPSSAAPGVRPTAPPAQRPAAPAAALPMRPMPPVQSEASRKELPAGSLDRYVQHLSELAGMVSCCIFDVGTGREVLHAGSSPNATDLASHGSALIAAMTTASRTLGFGHALPEAAITLGSHHLLLRAVPRHPGLALHAVLDKSHANLTLARLQVLRMDSLLDEAPPQYAERRTGPRAGPEARRS